MTMAARMSKSELQCTKVPSSTPTVSPCARKLSRKSGSSALMRPVEPSYPNCSQDTLPPSAAVAVMAGAMPASDVGVEVVLPAPRPIEGARAARTAAVRTVREVFM